MNLGNELKLKDVLYVPLLHYNLISIAKLCTDMRCVVTFSDDACVLQDRTRGLRLVRVSKVEESTTISMGHLGRFKQTPLILATFGTSV